MNVDAARSRVVCYALTDCAYIQPLAVGWGTDICSDGAWSTDTNPWGKLVCLIIDPATFAHPDRVCTARDDELCELPGVLACDRYPKPRFVELGGNRFEVKDSAGYRVDPGPNVFSSSAPNVEERPDGIYLRSVQRGGTWTSSEILLDRSLGLGTYEARLTVDVDALGSNEVIASFTYASPTEEIDFIECSRGLDIPAPHNCQNVVQPYSRSGNRKFFSLSGIRQFTHRVVWARGSVEFTVWAGHGAHPPPPEDVLIQWVYKGPDIPASLGIERMRFIRWRTVDSSPGSGASIDFIINAFTFEPLPVPPENLLTSGIIDLLGGPSVACAACEPS